MFAAVLFAICLFPLAGNAVTMSCNVTDMTLNGSAADACAFIEGNTTVPGGGWAVNTIPLWDGGWVEELKVEGSDSSDSVTLEGIQFTLSASPIGGNEGTWSLAAVDLNGSEPMDLGDHIDLIGVLKGSPGFAAYLFQDEVIQKSSDGTWQVTFVNNGGNNPGLSHFSLYIRPDDPVGYTPVPEPSSLLLIGSGILGLGVLGRKRMKK
ncbi:MAG: PEP-CTERM sorting domain-containing protein [Acidobacteria bacterium]|nr:PEP-CTERM sorting domain-containing protein [Acidobacteriota bacterium]